MKKTLALLLAVLTVFSSMVFAVAAEDATGTTAASSSKVNFVPVILADDMDENLTNWTNDYWDSTTDTNTTGVLSYDKTDKAAVRTWTGAQTAAGWFKFGYNFSVSPVDIDKMAAFCFDLYISDVEAMNVTKATYEVELKCQGGTDDNELHIQGATLASLYGGDLVDGWNHFEIPLSKFTQVGSVDKTAITGFRFFNEKLTTTAIGKDGGETTLKVRDIYFVDQLFYQPHVEEVVELTDFKSLTTKNGVTYSNVGDLKLYPDSIDTTNGIFHVINTTSESGEYLHGNGGWMSSSATAAQKDYENHGVKGALQFASSIDTSGYFTGLMFDIYIPDVKVDTGVSLGEDGTVTSSNGDYNQTLLNVTWYVELTSSRSQDNQEIGWNGKTFEQIFGKKLEVGKWNNVMLDITTHGSETPGSGEAYDKNNTNFFRIFNACAFRYKGTLDIQIKNLKTVRAVKENTQGGKQTTTLIMAKDQNSKDYITAAKGLDAANTALLVNDFKAGEETAVYRKGIANKNFKIDATGMDTLEFDVYVEFYGDNAANAATNEVVQSAWGNSNIVLEVGSAGTCDKNEAGWTQASLKVLTGTDTPAAGWYHYTMKIKDSAGNYVSPFHVTTYTTSYPVDSDGYAVDWSAINYFSVYMQAKITMPEGIGMKVAVDNLCFSDSSETKSAVKSASLSLTDSFALGYTVKSSKGIVSNPLVDVKFGDQAKKGVQLTAVEGTDDTYKFSFNDIYAQNLADTLTTTVKALDYNGQVITKTHTYSVKDYCAKMLGKTNTDLSLSADQKSALDQLLSDVLRYGAAAQTSIDPSAGNLATNGVALTGETKTYTKVEGDVIKPIVSNESTESSYKWEAATLVLGNTMFIRYYFTGEGTPTIKCTNANVGTYQGTFGTGKVGETECQYVDLPVYAGDFGTPYTLYFDDDASYTVTYSVNCYIASTYDGEGTNENLKSLLAAIYHYGTSVAAYRTAMTSSSGTN